MRPTHNKTKSEFTVNQLEHLVSGLNLPVNLNKIARERNCTPELSKDDSRLNLMIDISKSPRISNLSKIPSDDSKDDSILRDKLIKIIKENFKLRNNSPATTLDFYRLIKMIGKGAFGKVYLGVHLLTGKYVAIKSIENQYMKDESSKRKVFQEVLILKKTIHKNIIRLLEVFENKKYLFMVFEYASQGDLLTHVKMTGRLSEDEAKKIFIQIVEGVKYCHNNNILHRDIKLDNILLDGENIVKICDFGVSRVVKKGVIINEQCGTPAYIAPEIIKDKGYEGCTADLWSMGVLLYAMVTGTVPFKATNIQELHSAIINQRFSIPNFLSECCSDVISELLKVNPCDRIEINELAKCQWFQENPGKIEDKILDSSRKTSVSNNEKYMFDPSSFKELIIHNNIGGSNNNIQIVEHVLQKVEILGYPRDHIIKSLEYNSCTHASASYYLFYKEYQYSTNKV